jgi:uncharacterized protein YcbK (DUF882 family)
VINFGQWQKNAQKSLILGNHNKKGLVHESIHGIHVATRGQGNFYCASCTAPRNKRYMTSDPKVMFTRRGVLGAFAAAAVTAAPTFSNAAGFLRGAGDIRKIALVSRRTGERLETVYWIEGEYIPEALKEINYMMRDWRQNEVKAIDVRTIDIMAASHSLLQTSEPYQLLSGYRSPRTNNALRSKSRGVAKNSLHMLGKAADLRLGSRTVTQINKAAAACHAGGVGRYYGSNFVHMDCGPVRTWRG